jgi:hypothetical protein
MLLRLQLRTVLNCVEKSYQLVPAASTVVVAARAIMDHPYERSMEWL